MRGIAGIRKSVRETCEYRSTPKYECVCEPESVHVPSGCAPVIMYPCALWGSLGSVYILMQSIHCLCAAGGPVSRGFSLETLSPLAWVSRGRRRQCMGVRVERYYTKAMAMDTGVLNSSQGCSLLTDGSSSPKANTHLPALSATNSSEDCVSW